VRVFSYLSLKNTLKFLKEIKFKCPLKQRFENIYYFTRIKNQITAALIKLKNTAALPISLARLASL